MEVNYFAKHALSQTLSLSLSLTLQPESHEDSSICFCVWVGIRVTELVEPVLVL